MFFMWWELGDNGKVSFWGLGRFEVIVVLLFKKFFMK